MSKKISRWAIFLRIFVVTLIAGTPARVASQSAVERSAWDQATEENTASAYYNYLSQYPSGQFVERAVSALVDLGAFESTGATRQLAPQRRSNVPTYRGGTDDESEQSDPY